MSADGHKTFAVLELTGTSDDARQQSYDDIKNDLSAPGLQTEVGGLVPTDEAITDRTSADIRRAEGFSLPILLVLLLVIFGSLTSASLPLIIGGIGILGSFSVLRALTLFTPVSIFSVNITTILGLGLGIDYGLFMVSRFREEMRGSESVEQAVTRTVATAGRTVVFSGVTVAVALASLMLFPETFLRSMGYGGVLTVVVDMLAALTVMPALLAVLGAKVNSLRVRRSITRPARAVESGGWYRLGQQVMRRPLAVAGVIVVVLVLLGSPFLKIAWGGTDATVLPAGALPRIVTESLSRDFPGNPTAPIEVVIDMGGPIATSKARSSELASYTAKLGQLSGVMSAEVTGVRADLARVDLSYRPGPYSPAAQAIVSRVRDLSVPSGAIAYVGGQSALLADTLRSLGQTLPWMVLIVVLATFVLLFLAFGSVLLPLKAIVMNLVSLSVMFGVLVWVFQEGHLSRLLQFTPNGTIDPSTPILMFAIMFGLSMDYEVFLLSRDKGALRRHGRQRGCHRHRPTAHRRCHHQRRAHARCRHWLVLRLERHFHQDDGHRDDRGPRRRRHACAAAARPGDDEASRQCELVGSRPVATRLYAFWVQGAIRPTAHPAGPRARRRLTVAGWRDRARTLTSLFSRMARRAGWGGGRP